VRTIGNFCFDLVRAIVNILLLIAFIAAIFFCSQGVIQNLKAIHRRHDDRGERKSLRNCCFLIIRYGDDRCKLWCY
jgi:K+-transporting ATPase A subunit